MPATSRIMSTDVFRSFDPEQCIEQHDTSKRIPRPPNAFILYRSDFLRRKAVPPEVEKRQQNLSRIAGQCWNMLPDTEKVVWYSKAAVVRADHYARYPSRVSKDTDRVLEKDDRGRNVVERPLGPIHRSRSRKARIYRSPYCESMFSALHDSKPPFSASQTRIYYLTPTSESPSPLSLPHFLPPFPSHVSGFPLLRTQRKAGYPPHSSDSETLRWYLNNKARDLGTILSEIGSSLDAYLTHQPDSIATCVLPSTSLGHLPHSDSVFRIPPARY